MNEVLKRRKWLIGLVAALVVAVGVYLYRQYTQPIGEIVAGSFLPEEKDAKKMSEKELKKYADKKVDETKFVLKIYPEAEFEDGHSIGNIYIRNEQTNAYPIAVQVFENATNDLVYDSGAIDPGYEITEGALEKNLEKGTYNCTAKVSLFDPKSKEYKGQTEAELVLTVKN